MFGRVKRDTAALARALSSEEAMSLLFGGHKNVGSTLEKCKMYTNIPPKTEYFGVNFGISEKDSELCLAPSFPPCARRAEVEIERGGVIHKIIFSREAERKLTVNSTALYGIPRIKLGSIPLTVVVGISSQIRDGDDIQID